jgi:hypothetical protein
MTLKIEKERGGAHLQTSEVMNVLISYLKIGYYGNE